jgi:arsenate reductase
MAMAEITVYQKPTCTTCREVYKALKESGVDFKDVNYYTDRLSKAKLKELIKKMGIKASDLFRTKEEIYKTLKLSEKTLTEGEVVDLMLKYPDLIQRPIVEKGDKAILARPAERLKEIL